MADTEKIIHYRGWLEPDPDQEERKIHIVSLLKCEKMKPPEISDFYRVTFIDQYGVERSIVVNSQWKERIMNRKPAQVSLTVRRVVTSARIEAR